MLAKGTERYKPISPSLRGWWTSRERQHRRALFLCRSSR